MIPRTRYEKFQHHGSVERVQGHESIKDCADVLFGIKHHNDSQNKRGEVPTPCKCGEVPMPCKRKKNVLISFWVSSTEMSPRIGEEKFLHRRSVQRVLRRESIKDCASPLLGIKHHNDS